jgi:hypothetical protein
MANISNSTNSTFAGMVERINIDPAIRRIIQEGKIIHNESPENESWWGSRFVSSDLLTMAPMIIGIASIVFTTICICICKARAHKIEKKATPENTNTTDQKVVAAASSSAIASSSSKHLQ